MKEWRIRQEIYHRLERSYIDDLNKIDYIEDENIIENALRHFTERVDEFIYPAKSYFVAICYAHWISTEFNEDFYEALNDEFLLAGNDPFFVPYDEDKEIYDLILEKVTFPIEQKGMVPDVRNYYDSEIWLKSTMAHDSL